MTKRAALTCTGSRRARLTPTVTSPGRGARTVAGKVLRGAAQGQAQERLGRAAEAPSGRTQPGGRSAAGPEDPDAAARGCCRRDYAIEETKLTYVTKIIDLRNFVDTSHRQLYFQRTESNGSYGGRHSRKVTPFNMFRSVLAPF